MIESFDLMSHGNLRSDRIYYLRLLIEKAAITTTIALNMPGINNAGNKVNAYNFLNVKPASAVAAVIGSNKDVQF